MVSIVQMGCLNVEIEKNVGVVHIKLDNGTRGEQRDIGNVSLGSGLLVRPDSWFQKEEQEAEGGVYAVLRG